MGQVRPPPLLATSRGAFYASVGAFWLLRGFPVLRKLLDCACFSLSRHTSGTPANIAGPVPAPRAVICMYYLLLVFGLHLGPLQAWTVSCRFEMRIHKRLIDLHSPAEVVKQITSIR